MLVAFCLNRINGRYMVVIRLLGNVLRCGGNNSVQSTYPGISLINEAHMFIIKHLINDSSFQPIQLSVATITKLRHGVAIETSNEDFLIH
jgi:hypothetical protein